jgi:hypothetical protein
MKIIIAIFFALILTDCKRNSAINVNWKFSKEKLILTSDRFNTLNLYVPIDIEVDNHTDCDMTDIYFFASEVNDQYKYQPNFKTSKANIDFDYSNAHTIAGKEKKIITIYLGYVIKDSVLLKSEFNDELRFIKRNYNEKRNYINDTIRLSNLEEFKKSFPKYANEKMNLTSENIQIDMTLNCGGNIKFKKHVLTIPK